MVFFDNCEILIIYWSNVPHKVPIIIFFYPHVIRKSQFYKKHIIITNMQLNRSNRFKIYWYGNTWRKLSIKQAIGKSCVFILIIITGKIQIKSLSLFLCEVVDKGWHSKNAQLHIFSFTISWLGFKSLVSILPNSWGYYGGDGGRHKNFENPMLRSWGKTKTKLGNCAFCWDTPYYIQVHSDVT